MARVAILHNTLDFQGGADAVCLAACKALQTNHDVTLFTISETDPAALSNRFDVSIGNITVSAPPGSTAIAKAFSSVAPWAGSQLALRSVALHRMFRSSADSFDLAVSTANEFSLTIPSVQYIHYPQFNFHRLPDTDSGRLNQVWSRLAGPTRDELSGPDVSLLSNSSWTADVVDDIYGTQPAVLHPPVDPIQCDRSWSNREDGIVILGRLAPDKRVLDAISVIDRIRERGHDLHLHIVGATPRAYRDYVDRIVTAASERPYVSLERDVPRERIERLLCIHKYGLNMKQNEHFGMSVAEYCAAGMNAFAPDSGGQRDVLHHQSDHLFNTLDEAVSLIAHAAETGEPPSPQQNRFTREDFNVSLRDHVTRVLDRTSN